MKRIQVARGVLLFAVLGGVSKAVAIGAFVASVHFDGVFNIKSGQE